MRQELEQFERWVMLQIYDEAWKNNLHAMDQLRDSIGFRGIAQKDPRIEFKRGAAEAFNEMLEQVRERASEYNGFNLIVGNADALYWISNAEGESIRALEPGIYGLSNGTLDTPWPKVVRAKAQFASLLCQGAPDDAYFELLADTTRAADCRLPDTGVSLEWERLLSSICIESPDYGTRTSTLMRVCGNGSAELKERLIR